jgi:hypothetical protein
MKVGQGSSRLDAERPTHLVGDRRQAGPVGERHGPVQTGGEVAVAEAKPRLVAQGAEGVHHREGVAPQAVAPLRDATRQRVGHDVEVRADLDTVEDAVVPGVDDRHDLVGGDGGHQPA